MLLTRVSTPSPRITSWDGTLLQNRLYGQQLLSLYVQSADEASISAKQVFTRSTLVLQTESPLWVVSSHSHFIDIYNDVPGSLHEFLVELHDDIFAGGIARGGSLTMFAAR